MGDRGYSEQELLDEIHRLAEGDTPPKIDDIRKRGRMSGVTFYNHFESWNDALRQAGYQPHQRSHEVETVLREIRNLADETGIALKKRDFNTAADTSHTTVQRKLGSYWLGVVRAGVKPSEPQPLTESQFRAIYEAATSQPPKQELVTLLLQFTGITAEILDEISERWVETRPDATILTVPPRLYRSDDTDLWQIKIPETFQDEEIGLSGLLNWYLEAYEEIDASPNNVKKTVYDVAGSTEIDRREVEKFLSNETKFVPEVRPIDLKITSGIIMARNGAPASHIRQQLGLRHLDSILTVDQIFCWCEVHGDDFNHPDHEPVGLYLDPDTGELCGE